MVIELDWEKSLLSNKFTFIIKNENVGSYRYGLFKDNAEGELLNRSLRFRQNGILRKHTRIINPDNDEIIGIIKLRPGLFKNKADITLDGEHYSWSSKSTWSSKWELRDESSVRVAGNNNSLRGKFQVTQPNVPLILSAMYISRNFKDSNRFFTLLFVLPPVLQYLFRLTGG
ncbi:MAG: hypothetical protein HLUCCA01_04930 [Bacteroidetes bacterium HLUCCA01]|nr:MAG: hypothetical protein HLUCCA01_04930 [Bacteroidetes bacterium HLUCCA01]